MQMESDCKFDCYHPNATPTHKRIIFVQGDKCTVGKEITWMSLICISISFWTFLPPFSSSLPPRRSQSFNPFLNSENRSTLAAALPYTRFLCREMKWNKDATTDSEDGWYCSARSGESPELFPDAAALVESPVAWLDSGFPSARHRIMIHLFRNLSWPERSN